MTMQRVLTLVLAGGVFAALALVAAPGSALADSEAQLTESPAAVLMADGKELFLKNCKKCHGPDGKAATKMGTKHKIPDMTKPEWQSKHSKAEVVKVITEGKAETKMKAYKETLTADEIAAVADFVKGL